MEDKKQRAAPHKKKGAKPKEQKAKNVQPKQEKLQHSTEIPPEKEQHVLRAQAERALLYYQVVQGLDDSVFYFWEKDALEFKAKVRALYAELREFSEDVGRSTLAYPASLPAALRGEVHLIAKNLALFTHSDGDGNEKRVTVYKEERVDDYSDVVKQFAEDAAQTEMSFSSSLTSKERGQIHELAKELDLHSVSIGEGSNRHLVLSKQKKKITREDLTQRSRKFFLTLTHLPLPTTDSPLFEYFIDLYEPLLGSKTQLQEFLKVVEGCGGESNFVKHYNAFKEKVVQLMRATAGYQKLVATGVETIKKQYEAPAEVQAQLKRGNKPIFCPINHNKYFISLDLRSANFNCLRNHDPDIVLNCQSWDELAAKATPYKFIRDSKFLRQIVLGKLASKKHAPMWLGITARIYSRLMEEGVLKEEDLVAYSGDELVFLSNKEDIKESFRRIKQFLAIDKETQRFASWLKVEPFRLIRLRDSAFYVKEIFIHFDREEDTEKEKEDGWAFTPVIKCANADEFAQCYKVYRNEPITENDATTTTGYKKYIFQ